MINRTAERQQDSTLTDIQKYQFKSTSERDRQYRMYKLSRKIKKKCITCFLPGVLVLEWSLRRLNKCVPPFYSEI